MQTNCNCIFILCILLRAIMCWILCVVLPLFIFCHHSQWFPSMVNGNCEIKNVSMKTKIIYCNACHLKLNQFNSPANNDGMLRWMLFLVVHSTAAIISIDMSVTSTSCTSLRFHFIFSNFALDFLLLFHFFHSFNYSFTNYLYFFFFFFCFKFSLCSPKHLF